MEYNQKMNVIINIQVMQEYIGDPREDVNKLLEMGLDELRELQYSLIPLYNKEWNLKCSKKVWELLGNVPVNDDGEIEEDFQIEIPGVRQAFKSGTDREEIWSWIEERFDVSVVKDLMKI